MKNKTITITLIALLTLSSFGLLFTTLLTPAAAASEPMPLLDRMPIDATPEMLGEKEVAIHKYAAEVGAAEATQASPIGEPVTIGEELIVTVSDMGMNIDYPETFVVILDGTHGIILIEKAAYDAYDAEEDEYVFPDPYGDWREEDRISTEMLEYLLNEFDNNIYKTVSDVFGEPLIRGDEGKKTWILIHNIRDVSYYFTGETSYVAGYFSASENAVNNKNMMHIDSYDWENRVGPGVARPYLYEGVFAHEFEHLVHFDIDPDEPSWVDEGLANLSGYLCGYGHSSGHIWYYLAYHPMTSLTFWGGALEDYGASYLFQLYLFEKFGGVEFTSALVQEQANGIEGIETTLNAFGYSETFDEIFDDWTVANYLDDPKKGGGKYGYDTLDIGSADSDGMTIESVLALNWWGSPDDAPYDGWGIPGDWFFGITPQPYTAHYFRFTGKPSLNINLLADDYAGTLAYSGTYEWYSGAEAWAWRSFYQTFDIPAGGATLDFMTYFEIEEDWDYGYVEVYDQDTGEWYTLDAPGTVNYTAHPQDNPNTPDGREPSAYNATDRWHGFTGNSGGWIPVSMDLSPFAGHSIDLYFTLWQDGAYTLQNMYVDDIEIVGLENEFFDDVEAGAGFWDSTGWEISDGKQYNHWGVTAMDVKGALPDRYPETLGKLHSVRHMMTGTISEFEQFGTLKVPATPSKSGRVQVAVVSNHADHILPSNYLFWVS